VSVEQLDVVDITSVDARTGHVVLTISDHLDWTDVVRHQVILQRKLNAYFAFVESGELLKQVPDAQGRPVRLNIVFKFLPNEGGIEFLDRARLVVSEVGFELTHEVLAEAPDSKSS
jgi:hypothetical protein